MGPYELECRERAKAAKARLYPTPPKRQKEYLYRVCTPDEDWVKIMYCDPTGGKPEASIRLIQNATAAYFQVSLSHMLSNRRHVELVRARHISMYLCRELTALSFPEIGRRHRDRDHTTVLHGWRKINSLLYRDPDIAKAVREIKRRFVPFCIDNLRGVCQG